MQDITTVELSYRDRALLRAVAAGDCELSDRCGPVLTIGGRCCCDQFAAPRLTRYGLIDPARGAEPRRARLTPRGRAALASGAPR